MRIGFAQTDITPPPGTPLAGQIVAYAAKDVESRLYARAMCLDDKDVGVVIISCDVLMIPNDFAGEVRKRVSAATGIPESHVVVCATHTHSGPSTAAVLGSATDTAYVEKLKDRVVEAAEAAWRTRRKGGLSVASGELEGYAFNRRFIMSDGTIETHPLKGDPHIVRAEGPDSTALRVLYAADAAGRPLGAVVNFGCHPTVMHRANERISADFPGRVSEHLSNALGNEAVALFLQGACGNVCQVDPRNTDSRELGPEWTKTMGGALSVLTRTIELPRRAPDPQLVAWAKQHVETNAEPPVASDYGVERFDEIQLPAMALQQVFKTPYWADFYAREIRTLEAQRAREPNLTLTIKVIAQDNWAMVTLPCELFVEWSHAIYEQSPFPCTVVVELANGWNGYVPTRTAFERAGGYETKEVTSTMLVPEAGEMILSAVVDMLDDAKRRGD